jgi:hypothetical protein
VETIAARKPMPRKSPVAKAAVSKTEAPSS